MSPVLPLPHHQQSRLGRCLPACAKMILAGLGHNYREGRLSRVLGTTDIGTLSSSIRKLESLGFSVQYTALSLRELALVLSEGNPVVVYIQTMFFEHWDVDTAHAVVVVGMESEQHFWIHDPELPDGPTLVSWNGLLAIWQEFNFYGAVIRN